MPPLFFNGMNLISRITAYLILPFLGVMLPFISGPGDLPVFTLFFISANLLVFAAILNIIKDGKISLPISSAYILPLIFLCYLYAGQIYSINRAATKFGALLFGSAIACGLSIPLLNLSKKAWRFLLTTLIITATSLSLYAAYQYLALGGNYAGRAHSVFVNPNSFSGYLVLIIPLLLGVYFSAGKYWKWLLVPIAIQYAALLASGKGGRWFVFVVAIFFALFFYRIVFPRIARTNPGSEGYLTLKQRVKPLLPVLLLVTILFVIPFDTGAHNEISPGSMREAFPPMAERLKIWQSTWQVIKENPVAGTGYFTFHNIYLKYKDPAYRDVNHFFTHNDYLQLWSETGVAGLIIFMFFIFFYFRDGLKILQGNRLPFQDSCILSGALIGSLIMLVHTSIDFDLYIPAILFIFWCYAGYVVSNGRETGLYRHTTIDFSSNRLFRLLGQRKLYIIVAAVFLFSTLWLMGPYLGSKHSKRGNEYLKAEDYEKAVAAYKRAIKIDPLDASHHFNLANALRASNSQAHFTLDEAEREFRKAIELEPYRPELTFGLANFYLNYYPEEKSDISVELFKKVIELDPTDPNNILNLVKIYEQLKMDNEALNLLETMKTKYPFYTAGLMKLVEVYMARKDYENAIEEADIIIKIEPENNYAHFLKANILQDMGQYDDAHKEYQFALREKGKEADVWYAIGGLFLKQGKKKEAEEAFKRTLEYNKNDFRAADALGKLSKKMRERQ